jgi:hypothetical protein
MTTPITADEILACNPCSAWPPARIRALVGDGIAPDLRLASDILAVVAERDAANARAERAEADARSCWSSADADHVRARFAEEVAVMLESEARKYLAEAADRSNESARDRVVTWVCESTRLAAHIRAMGVKEQP